MKRILCFIIAFMLMFPLPARANSGQQIWGGRTGQGLYVTEENCPIEVEKELLTLNINSFPQIDYREYSRLAGYDSTAVAEYTFKNPADYDVEATLVFPFGHLPYYINIYEENRATRTILPDSDRYSVTVNGSEIPRRTRYTFSPGEFDAETEMAKIRDSYAEDSFFRPDATVMKYTYSTRNIGDKKGPCGEVNLVWKNETDRTALLPAYYSYFSAMGTDSAELRMDVRSGDSIVLYTIGEKLPRPPQPRPADKSAYTDADVSLVETAEMTFEEFIFTEWEKYDENLGISRTDWYNMFVDCFNHNMMTGKKIIGNDSRYYHIHDSIMAWYQYDLAVPAGGTVANTVTAPLYPAMDYTYEPPVFDYTYYLSPAAGWADFGGIEIEINTPFFINKSTLELEKTDSGYRYKADGLPQGELTLTMSESENPRKAKSPYSTKYLSTFIVMIVLPPLALIAVTVSAVKIIRKLLKIK